MRKLSELLPRRIKQQQRNRIAVEWRRNVSVQTLSASLLNVGNGRRASVGRPAGFRVDRTFERLVGEMARVGSWP